MRSTSRTFAPPLGIYGDRRGSRYLRSHRFVARLSTAKEWFAGLGRQRLAITPVVWMETVQGAMNRDRRDQAIRFLRQFRIEHSTEDDNRWAMRQTARFHLSHSLQLQDAMIASVAVRLDVPLYTTNLKHFQPLPSLDAKKPY